MNEKLTFRKLKETDWEQVKKIYSEGIDTGNATFETNVPNWSNWDDGHLPNCRIVAEKNGEVIGWSALSPVSSRCVYRGVAEVSVYVSKNFTGQKIGTKLLEQLIAEMI